MSTAAREDVLRDANIDDLDFAPTADQEAAVTAPEDAPATATGPVIQVLKGNPSDAEIGALVAVLTAAASAASAEPGSGLPVDNWGTPTSMHRTASPSSPYGYRHVARTLG